MFVGHYGISFAAGAADPTIPLPALMISTQLLDVAWSTFILAGIEKARLKRHFTATNDLDLYYLPYSHGLITAAGWSLLAGLVSFVLLPSNSLFAAALMAGGGFFLLLLDLFFPLCDMP